MFYILPCFVKNPENFQLLLNFFSKKVCAFQKKVVPLHSLRSKTRRYRKSSLKGLHRQRRVVQERVFARFSRVDIRVEDTNRRFRVSTYRTRVHSEASLSLQTIFIGRYHTSESRRNVEDILYNGEFDPGSG